MSDTNSIKLIEKFPFSMKALFMGAYILPTLAFGPFLVFIHALSMADLLRIVFTPSSLIDLVVFNLGLENRLKSEVGLLSGGQRQALTLLMATLETPELLLLDEHTAALDPKTSRQILEITKKIVEKDKIPTLMITHNIQNAMEYGNKTLIMAGGSIIKVLEGEERRYMTVQDIMKLYASTDEVLSDRSLLS